MPIESSPNIPSPGVAGLRQVGTIDARTVRLAAGAKDQAAVGSTPDAVATPAATFQPSQALDPGQAPVDVERVKVIRHAIETGTYPVIPAKIADAMIAAGLLLRTPA
ncbi:flagellar biosynthesis anti-sigma factor FlgM [Novosphingobium piscinae]|uniref:Flagellar biosynthesis anti-sigma factor FlgM n=1 Tax=Novosphingobium piscinae TaxID=1507448 RepID=A0A7X1KR63_9SPHN|nr:flagellar biosynthesis anti-sigma factor FlgM [Novosphingobium piscinae]MBC2670451.1 flagellar biosynthesis anti-sigma factor FlgM [Novosphingobium piscinae]